MKFKGNLVRIQRKKKVQQPVKVTKNVNGKSIEKKFKKKIVVKKIESEDELTNNDSSAESDNGNESTDDNSKDDGFSDNESGNDSIEEHSDKSDKHIDNSDVETNNEDIVKPNYVKRKFNKGESDEEVDDNAAKKAKLPDYYKPPTAEEIIHLKETENLYHSSLFRMQIDEMLKEVKFPKKHESKLEVWLKEFNEYLSILNSQDESDENNLKWLKKSKIKLPIISEAVNVPEIKFCFLKPNPATIIGSFGVQTVIGPIVNVDLGIEMPAKCFRKGDNLNEIYHRKRALFLCFLANHFTKNKELIEEVEFTSYRNEPLKPILVITPAGKLCKKVKFCLHLLAAPDTFKLSRFIPQTNNVRPSVFNGDSNDNTNPEDYPATPYYNSTILFDLTLRTNYELLSKTINTHGNVKDAIVLLKIWLKQRSLDIGHCGFSGYMLSMFIVYLLQTRKIFLSMSSYQIVRCVWNHLGISNWDKNGITLCNAPPPLSGTTNQQPTIESFNSHYDVVFVDVTGYMNICSNLSLDLYLRVKYESVRAMNLLDNNEANAFNSLFMIKMPYYLQYDNILVLHDEEKINELLNDNVKEKLNYCGYWYPHLLKLITRVLRKGLDKRVIAITPIESTHEDQQKCWSVKEKPIKIVKLLKLGFILDPEEAYNIITKGPAANLPEANDFREFWGEKSTLRRFKDGEISEACLWCPQNAPLHRKRLICTDIINNLLTKSQFKFNENSSFNIIGDEVTLVTQIHTKDAIETCESLTLPVIYTFDNIASHFRQILDLPLQITAVRGLSPVFSYCDINVCKKENTIVNKQINKVKIQSKCLSGEKLFNGILQLSTSGKWPDNLDAIKRIKAAFYLKIANSSVWKKENPEDSFKLRGHVNGVDVLKGNYCFRYTIVHPKELNLLKMQTNDRLTKYVDTNESLAFERDYFLLPKLRSTLHGIYQQNTSFGLGVCIAKRWLYSQLIDNTMWPDECTELLLLSLILKSYPYNIPIQPQLCFLRLLNLLANTDWLNEFILINFNNEMTADEITQIENKFKNERSELPPLTIFTSLDNGKMSVWTKCAPSVEILTRVVVLARNTIKNIEKELLLNFTFNSKQYFVPSLVGYNAIIHLKYFSIRRSLLLNIENGKPLYDCNEEMHVVDAGYDPVDIYLKELREAYKELALFFYNPCGGQKIAVLFRPETKQNDLKVTNISCIKLNKKTKNIEFNCEAALNDFEIMGKGLVTRVEKL